jgi:hypothetical protein
VNTIGNGCNDDEVYFRKRKICLSKRHYREEDVRMKEILRLKQVHGEKYKRLNNKWKLPKKKAEIEARKYELLQLQLSLPKANDESSQSSSKYVTWDKVCESIPEKL